MRLGVVFGLLAFGAIGCSKQGDTAIVAPNNPTQKRVAECTSHAAPTHQLDIQSSRIDVAGADKVTGEHVGRIHRMSGTATLSDKGVPTAVTIEADLTSLTMDSSAVESFVKSSSFLDVGRYPKSTFRSCEIVKDGTELKIRGILMLHGVTREVSYRASLTTDRHGQAYRANFRLPRHDFRIEREDMLDSLISSDIRIQMLLRAKPLQPAEPANRSVAETSADKIPGSNAE